MQCEGREYTWQQSQHISNRIMNGLRQAIRKDRPYLGNTPSCLVSAAWDSEGGCLRLQAATRVHRLPHTRSNNWRGKLRRLKGSREKPGAIRNRTSYSHTYSPNLECPEQTQRKQTGYAHRARTPAAETRPPSSSLATPAGCCERLLKQHLVFVRGNTPVCILARGFWGLAFL